MLSYFWLTGTVDAPPRMLLVLTALLVVWSRTDCSPPAVVTKLQDRSFMELPTLELPQTCLQALLW